MADLQAVILAIKVGPYEVYAVHFLTSVAGTEQLPEVGAVGSHRHGRLVDRLYRLGPTEPRHIDVREIHMDAQYIKRGG
jgi:hypothetical protein